MMLAMFAGKNREDWDDLLPAVMNKCDSIPAKQCSARSAYMTVEQLSDYLQWETG